MFSRKELVHNGIELCRRGYWRHGFEFLNRVEIPAYRDARIPSIFYSYYGYGQALIQQDYKKAEEMCQRAVGLDGDDPELYYFLAKVQIMASQRREACLNICKGLRLSHDHEGLLKLKRRMDVRRRPVIPYLKRNHPINIKLARRRYRR